MAIDTQTKREASHRFGRGPTTRWPEGSSAKFSRAIELGLYHQDIILLEPAPAPVDGWRFGAHDRVLMFGRQHRIWRFRQ